MKRKATLSGLGLIIVCLVIVWLFGSLVAGRSGNTASPLPRNATAVHILASDSTTLTGHFWSGADDKAPAILLLHGLGGSRSQFDEQGAALSQKGYAVLAINLRGHGDSGGEMRSFGLFEARDAHAAFLWLKERQHGAKVGVSGLSLGGAAALLGPIGPVPADALVLTVVYPDIRHAIHNRIAFRLGNFLASLGEPLLSYQAPLRYGVWLDELSPETAIKSFNKPVLVIGGESDSYTPPVETRAIFEAANAPKQLWIVPKGDHNSTVAHPEYFDRVERFFEATLR